MATPSIAAGEGRTRWRRFGLVAGLGLAVVALVGYLAVSGALALSFAFSGIPFTLHADSLSGQHFVQYAVPDAVANDPSTQLNSGAAALINAGQTPPLVGTSIPNTTTVGSPGTTYVSDTVTQLGTATITGLHQQVCSPLPGPLSVLGAIRVTIIGAGTTTAGNLVIQAPALTADSAGFSNIVIGQTVESAISKQGVSDPYGLLGSPLTSGSFAQGADSVLLKNVNQIGIGTEAGSFNIGGLKLYAEFQNTCG